MNQLTNTFKALSDDTRLRIIMVLHVETLCVCELSGILETSQPRISQSLAKLRDMDLVVDERVEKYVYYSIQRENQLLMKLIRIIENDEDHKAQLSIDRKRVEKKDAFTKQSCSTDLL